MIYVGTNVVVVDNSGAKKAKCIKVFGSQAATIGDVILVSIQRTLPKQKTNIQKGTVQRALVTECRKKLRRLNGTAFRFEKNSVILISAQNQPLASRMSGILTNELRQKKYTKVFSLGARVV